MKPIIAGELIQFINMHPGITTPEISERFKVSVTYARWAVLESGGEFYDGNHARMKPTGRHIVVTNCKSGGISLAWGFTGRDGSFRAKPSMNTLNDETLIALLDDLHLEFGSFPVFDLRRGDIY